MPQLTEEWTSSCTLNSSGVYNYFLVWINIFRRNKALVKELSKPPPGTSDLYFPTQYSQSSFGQFKFCLWKQWWTYWRSPDYNLVRMFFAFVTALVLGVIFWRVGLKMYVYNAKLLLCAQPLILLESVFTGCSVICYLVQEELGWSFSHCGINVCRCHVRWLRELYLCSTCCCCGKDCILQRASSWNVLSYTLCPRSGQ